MAGLPQGPAYFYVEKVPHACLKLARWFEERWDDHWCLDSSKELLEIIEKSWARETPLYPYYIYLKIAYPLSREARAGLTEFRIYNRCERIEIGAEEVRIVYRVAPVLLLRPPRGRFTPLSKAIDSNQSAALRVEGAGALRFRPPACTILRICDRGRPVRAPAGGCCRCLRPLVPNMRITALSRRWILWAALFAVGYAVLAGGALVTESPPPRSPNDLRWGGDKTGGGPFIFEADGELKGFEVELADYLADELGLHSRFVQGSWDKLLPRLNRHDIDLALNGFEWTAERESEWTSTIPYYVYRLQLLARDPNDPGNTDPIRSWDDLKARPDGSRRKIGVLSSSSAQRYVEKEYGDQVDVLAYSEGVTSAMRGVENGQLDATVQDYPAAVYYANYFPALRPIGPAVAPGYYVIFVRKSDKALRDKLNEVLKKALRQGKLKDIYTRYGIWTSEQDQIGPKGDSWPPEAPQPTATWADLFDYFLLLVRAAWTTVLLSCLSMPLAMLLGLMVAVSRLYGPRWLGIPLGAYVEFLRGTPLLMQLFVIYFLLPEIGIKMAPFWAGVLGLAINYSAYESENYRAGLLAIPRGQMEAALALGMTRWTALYRVIIPQAVRIVIPPVTNDFIALFKDTSVCSVIAVTELTGRSSELYNNHPSLVLQVGLMTAALYLLMSYPLSLVARRLEKSFPRVNV
jgi:polar amino acid transport system substrate-binding protein